MERRKRLALISTALGLAFFLTLLGGGSYSNPFGEVAIAEAGPNITVAPAPVPYKKGKVWISGSGFKPKQELGIRVMMGGVMSDISFLVKPRPIANEFGAFSSVWKSHAHRPDDRIGDVERAARALRCPRPRSLPRLVGHTKMGLKPLQRQELAKFAR